MSLIHSLAWWVVLNLAIDPWYPYYYQDFFSIVDGIEHYNDELQTVLGVVHLSYHRNLIWDRDSLNPDPKPFPKRDFSTFERYRCFLLASLNALADNMRASSRIAGYEPISTASSGYDSLAVSVLTQEIDNRDVISFETDRFGRDDNGAEFCSAIGV